MWPLKRELKFCYDLLILMLFQTWMNFSSGEHKIYFQECVCVCVCVTKYLLIAVDFHNMGNNL